ncbi:UDP-N-acetylmuramoyl-tripeptide--D-alanyl-D-alanine ligase [Apibacter muscae]|uniref:UDP-N-acetylmuramoyl-tripeptide--D-alanyl-D- alanine ligase n=1 Tax=Apibacter muscae TaxID=2509004 RepID=UPI0011ADD830|nr:UDP-N-acetylmuramoyl-tripeptide--D-alanyl-D-alanine ligase [Apibacter muscae]TWP24441.1 UDP-N-acetylmuramoyl-tripeptide--D-alanyl-D-alanine ligase [Apibacter muscae]
MTIEELYSIYLQSSGVTTDTRKITSKSIYFALKGENFNGNLFANEAIEHGALVAVVDDRSLSNPSKGIFYFENSLLCLQNLARYHREQLNIPIIGLTGSNGKTTTKELMASILKEKFNVWYTQGNLNNHIGVPLTLLSINQNHEIAIVEMGANHLKEIELLSGICQPTIGYITNFGKAHLEGFGGMEGVYRGKSELYSFLRENHRKVIVNTDDTKQMELSNGIDSISFGTEGDYTYSYQENSNHTISLIYQNCLINSQLTGKYNYTNLCAAATLGLYFGIEIGKIKVGIENYLPQNQRSQIVKLGNKTLVLDTYNANPSSMEASLKNFSVFEGSKTIILGDMFELGKESAYEHSKIVSLALNTNFDNIFLVGENFYSTTIDDFKIKKFKSTEEAKNYFKEHSIVTKNLLLKGSRGMALEKLLNVIKE